MLSEPSEPCEAPAMTGPFGLTEQELSVRASAPAAKLATMNAASRAVIGDFIGVILLVVWVSYKNSRSIEHRPAGKRATLDHLIFIHSMAGKQTRDSRRRDASGPSKAPHDVSCPLCSARPADGQIRFAKRANVFSIVSDVRTGWT